MKEDTIKDFNRHFGTFGESILKRMIYTQVITDYHSTPWLFDHEKEGRITNFEKKLNYIKNLSSKWYWLTNIVWRRDECWLMYEYVLK